MDKAKKCNLGKSGANLTNMSGLVWNACHVYMECGMPGMEYGTPSMECMIAGGAWNMPCLV